MKLLFLLAILLPSISHASVESSLVGGLDAARWKFHYTDFIFSSLFGRRDVDGTVSAAGPTLGAMVKFTHWFGVEGNFRALRAYHQEYETSASWRHSWFANFRGNAMFYATPTLFGFVGLNSMKSVGTKGYDADHFGVGYQLGAGGVIGQFLVRAYYETNGNISLFGDGNSFKGAGITLAYLFRLGGS